MTHSTRALTRVVHCRFEPFDIYCGRPSRYGNPFSDKPGTLAKYRVATREESILRHEAWFLAQPELVEEVKRVMAGKILGCFCKYPHRPLPCHCDVYVRVCNEGLIVEPEQVRETCEQLGLLG